jgi:hypothetical protein
VGVGAPSSTAIERDIGALGQVGNGVVHAAGRYHGGRSAESNSLGVPTKGISLRRASPRVATRPASERKCGRFGVVRSGEQAERHSGRSLRQLPLMSRAEDVTKEDDDPLTHAGTGRILGQGFSQADESDDAWMSLISTLRREQPLGR